uniref:Uncharacterized protein n=1 Tax=Arundo donax TaxID=35708 RepID=A0A0A9DCT8_ARUDO
MRLTYYSVCGCHLGWHTKEERESKNLEGKVFECPLQKEMYASNIDFCCSFTCWWFRGSYFGVPIFPVATGSQLVMLKWTLFFVCKFQN